MRYPTLFLTIALFGGTTAAMAGTCSARSGDSTVALLELYTSEGCSSCPPADQWLTGLRSGALIPGRVVPLALHVDYWNNLGWEDVYSQKAFTDRQYRMAEVNRMRTVYTPQFVLNGRDLSRWRSRADDEIRRINAIRPRADIALNLSRHDGRLDVIADAVRKNHGSPADLYVALYENNLTRDIGAGENLGLTLHHDFVVRQLIGPVSLDKDGKLHFTGQMAPDNEWKDSEMGVAAFVQDRDSGEVLQALALPLCR